MNGYELKKMETATKTEYRSQKYGIPYQGGKSEASNVAAVVS